ncbi:MAG: hypothetical protein ABID87_01985 [Chloroflexota bacterium]
MAGDSSYEVLYPRGRRTVADTATAPRLSGLEGKTVAELWNWAFRGHEIFPLVEEELTRRYPGIKFVDYRVFGSIHGGNEREVIAALPGMLKEHDIDAVITTSGC